MRPPWMDPDVPGPTALCVTDPSAREAHQWASDVPGGPQSAAVRRAHSEARFWCNRCDVSDACLSFALAAEGKDDDRARDGVYGGVDPIGRATLAGRSPKVFPPIACGVCNTKFAPGSSSARYCSDKCSLTAVRRRQSERVKAKRDLARQGQAA